MLKRLIQTVTIDLWKVEQENFFSEDGAFVIYAVNQSVPSICLGHVCVCVCVCMFVCARACVNQRQGHGECVKQLKNLDLMGINNECFIIDINTEISV
jgi:hypothetical protein